MHHENLYSLFADRVARYSGRDVFFVRREGRWTGTSWERFGDDSRAFGGALAALGLTPGRSVAILMGTVPEWPVADIGTILAGGVSVGLYPTSSAEQCRYVIDHSDAEFVIVDTRDQLEKVLSVRSELTAVKAFVSLDETAALEADGVLGYIELLELGRRRGSSDLEAMALDAHPDETAIMVYTSGTTGVPKGACLSHRYVLECVRSLRATTPIDDADVAFSYLPYCHVAERISGFYNRLAAGAPAYFVNDLRTLWDDMLTVRPTVFASLPRFFEKVHARIMADLETAPADERRQFDEALEVGRRVSRLRQGGEPLPDELTERFERLVGPVSERVRAYFGGRLRLATSGGAPLLLEVAEFFDAFGVNILQAYGLTECLCVAFNRPDLYRFGTVGPAMPGCEIRIAGDGEILVRSTAMFSGYHKEPDRTAEVLRDGWIFTGDLGNVDDDGFLRITGRKKEIIVTSTGKNIAPALVENLVKERFLVSQVMVSGDGKSYLVALITLNTVEAEAFAQARGIEYTDFADLTRKPEILAEVRAAVESANARLSSTEQIKRFVVLDRDLSVEAGEVTPTLKLRRDVVTRRYGHLLEALYADRDAVAHGSTTGSEMRNEENTP